MSSVSDYVGRFYDLAIFQNVKSEGESLLAQRLFGENSGSICTGIQKICQRVVIELMTDAESILYGGTDRGTFLLGAIRRGEIRTETDVYSAFSLAAARIERLFSGLETTDDVDDERLASLTLTGLSLSSEKLVMNIQIQSVAGSSRAVILPITQLP